MSKLQVAILGASGYGGAELLRRLRHHPHAEVAAVSSRQYEGRPLGEAWPQFAGDPLGESLRFVSTPAAVERAEFVLSALPHGAALEVVKEARDAGKGVVDLSADYRLSPADYERWYGRKHPYPELCHQAVYGLSELHRDELGGAGLVANPGCHATAAALALAPLAANGLLGPDVVVHSATGVSGAGREPARGFHYSDLNDNYKPYGVAGTHRHTAEIEDSLGRVRAHGRRARTRGGFEPVLVSFNPHLAPMTRGILASCTTRPQAAPDEAELQGLYRDFYAGDRLVHVQAELPQTKAVYGSDCTLISVRKDARSGHILAFATLDNLGKGAAGQAVQNLNLVCGFEETAGLSLDAVYP